MTVMMIYCEGMHVLSLSMKVHNIVKKYVGTYNKYSYCLDLQSFPSWPDPPLDLTTSCKTMWHTARENYYIHSMTKKLSAIERSATKL